MMRVGRGLESDFRILQHGCALVSHNNSWGYELAVACFLAGHGDVLRAAIGQLRDVLFDRNRSAHRAFIAALRNTHFCEMALMGPGMPNLIPPIYTCGYSDLPEDLPADGCVSVPDAPGLGVQYDCEFIERNRVALFV